VEFFASEKSGQSVDATPAKAGCNIRRPFCWSKRSFVLSELVFSCRHEKVCNLLRKLTGAVWMIRFVYIIKLRKTVK